MIKKLSGTKHPIKKAGNLRRVSFTLVVLLLVSVLMVGAGSSATVTGELKDGIYTISNINIGNTDFPNEESSTYTISNIPEGTTKVVVDGGSITASLMSTGLDNDKDTVTFDCADTVPIIIKNVQANGALDFIGGKSLTFEGCTLNIAWQVYPSKNITFTKCTFDDEGLDFNKPAIGTAGGVTGFYTANAFPVWFRPKANTDLTITFDGCTFNGNRGIHIDSTQANSVTLKVTNCKFNLKASSASNEDPSKISCFKLLGQNPLYATLTGNTLNTATNVYDVDKTNTKIQITESGNTVAPGIKPNRGDFRVQLNANDGTTAVTYGFVTPTGDPKEGTYTLPECDIIRPGYTFAGWADAENGEAITTESIQISADTNLYALWALNAPKPFTISADKDAIIAGETAILTASVPEHEADGVTYLYQWYSVTEDIALDGQTGKTLTVTPAKKTEYNCTVTATKDNAQSETIKSTNTITIDVAGKVTPDAGTDVTVNENGAATIAPSTGGDDTSTITVQTSNDGKTTATIENSGLTITLTSSATVTTTDSNGAVTSITGTFEEVEAKYDDAPAQLSTGGTATSALTIKMTPAAIAANFPMPTIDTTVDTTITEKVTTYEGQTYTPLTMIKASYTGTGGLQVINNNISERGVVLKFTLPDSVGQALVAFHVDDNGKATLLAKDRLKVEVDGAGNILATIEGDSFSSYVLAQGTYPEEKQTNGGSSTPQGSSVWLTETQTPTETPSEQPTTQPTDVAPTDVPTTQPTQTETPGFGVLAVLAGLGAVAVLRRK